MAFRPAVLSYDDLRRRAEEFLDEFHSERTLPVSIEDHRWFEFQANSFAGLVLVPAVELRREFERVVKTARVAGLTDATLWSEAGKGYIARWLATQFEASEQVIERRMEKDGLWPAPPGPTP